MNPVKEVLKLIPPDMLHWSPIDKKFALFTDEEYQKIIENCIWAGAEEDEIMIFVREMERARRGELLVRRLLEGGVTIEFDDTGEVVWKAVEHDAR
jgi:hypothetical protein